MATATPIQDTTTSDGARIVSISVGIIWRRMALAALVLLGLSPLRAVAPVRSPMSARLLQSPTPAVPGDAPAFDVIFDQAKHRSKQRDVVRATCRRTPSVGQSDRPDVDQ